MKIKSLAIVCLFLLTFLTHSLHLQQQQPYDPQKYYDSLQQKQQTLKQDLTQIQNLFKQIDSSLADQANDPTKKLQILQEGLADERDALISIQQYLNLPLNQRSCQCFNFTDQMKQQLQAQLLKVKQSIADVEANTKQCADCQFIIEIKKEIDQQKNYLNVMEDTLQAKCCKIYDIRYKDDLTPINWKYGNQTPQQYNQELNKIGASQDDVLVKTCPQATPYSVQNYTRCINCEDPNLVFNLKTRTCEQCPIGKIFNYEKHKCQLVCPPGTKLNQKLEQCQEIVPDFNSSSCPKDRPIWNNQVLGCFKCPQDKPFYDQKNKKCIECPQGYHYEEKVGECIHQQCNIGEYFDTATLTCRLKQEFSGSASSCPNQKPFWDPTSLSCVPCPLDKPYFNDQTQKCEVCPENTKYAQIYGKCIEKCGEGQVLNQQTWRCMNTTNPEENQVINNGDYASLCPPEKPVWNPDSKSCSRCSSDLPFWDSLNKRCSKCKTGYEWNPYTLKCDAVIPTCSNDEHYDLQQKKCVPIDIRDDTQGLCPPEKPFYNSDSKACQQCPQNLPYYNKTEHRCQEEAYEQPVQQQTKPETQQNSQQTIGICPPNFKYDFSSQVCIPIVSSPEQSQPVPQPLPQQTSEQEESIKQAQCPPQMPVWNKDLLVCEQCPSNTVWDSSRDICIQCEGDDCDAPETSPAPVIPKECPAETQLNSETNQCESCKVWEVYSSVTRSCKAICKIGQIYKKTQKICVGTISYCSAGLVWDRSELRCKCSQGANYKYSEQKSVCEQVCQNTEFYDSVKEVCVPY